MRTTRHSRAKRKIPDLPSALSPDRIEAIDKIITACMSVSDLPSDTPNQRVARAVALVIKLKELGVKFDH